MSEETNNNIIEESKSIPKNPGRVAWGKKLAKMSKELKEKKKAGSTEEIKLIKKDIKIDKATENKLDLHHIEVMVGVGGLLVAAIALYFQYKNNNKQTIQQQIPHQPINSNPYYSYNNF